MINVTALLRQLQMVAIFQNVFKTITWEKNVIKYFAQVFQ